MSDAWSKPEHYWLILNDKGQAWSNEVGWVTGDDYDLFSDDEKAAFNLPIGGHWHDPEAV